MLCVAVASVSFSGPLMAGTVAPALAIADLASDVRKLKHPFDQGVKGQPGIEW